MDRINPKEASTIIKSLEAGVVPDIGLGHLLVGRKAEVDELIKILANIENGDSDLRFWVGDFGSGKSFMLKTISSQGCTKAERTSSDWIVTSFGCSVSTS